MPPRRRKITPQTPATTGSVFVRCEVQFLAQIRQRVARSRIFRRLEMVTHKRIRQFNTRDTYPEQNLDNDLCQTVVARGTMVFVRGQIGQNIDTSESVGIGDAAVQAEQAMKNISTLLNEAGSRLEHITKVAIYIIDPRYRETVYRVVGKWLKGVFPVSTGIVVSALGRPEWLVEIDVTAVIPDDERSH